MERQRIDQWLWMTRFFKSRSLARKAVAAGHVQLGGKRAKPASPVEAGTRISLRRGQQQFELRVTAIPVRRGPASEAVDHYEETPESVERREREAELRKFERASSGPARKPDKRSRRQLAALKKQSEEF